MQAILRHPLRFLGRSLWLGGELLLGAVTYVLSCVIHRNASLEVARAVWLQRLCRRVLRIFRMNIRVSGSIPTSGLLVSNHLSYLDILVYAAVTPANFVAKREVRGWPVFGWFARLAGTVFVDRERRTRAGHTAGEIETLLQTGALVILFPEGTSSDGQTVLPFKSALLAPATRQSHPLSVACIGYELDDGEVGEEVCYWKDMTFFPHLVNLLTKRRIRAKISFARLEPDTHDRKQLAVQMQKAVLQLKETGAALPGSVCK